MFFALSIVHINYWGTGATITLLLVGMTSLIRTSVFTVSGGMMRSVGHCRYCGRETFLSVISFPLTCPLTWLSLNRRKNQLHRKGEMFQSHQQTRTSPGRQLLGSERCSTSETWAEILAQFLASWVTVSELRSARRGILHRQNVFIA